MTTGADFILKRGDLLPEIVATLVGADGEPINGSGATVRFHARVAGTKAAAIDAPAVWENQAGGIAKYAWVTGDTDVIEAYECEFEVTFSDTRTLTFPNDGMKSLRIGEDIA